MLEVSTQAREARWIHRIFGPTTVHLKHEFFLWLSLSILCASSLESLYRSSYGTLGDRLYCLLASLWLARNLILRYIYTREVSTIHSPTLLGVITHWLTSFAVAGQYFDRSDSHVVAKNVGIAHAEEDVMNPGSLLSIPSLSYTLQYFRIILFDPLEKMIGCNLWKTFLGLKCVSLFNVFQQFLSHPTLQRVGNYCPPLQLILAASVFSTCIFYLQTDPPSRRMDIFALTMQPTTRHDGSYTTRDVGGQISAGEYESIRKPSWYQIFFLISCTGTMLSIFFYGRISFPIPDLVAGTNVLKAVRNEARGTSGKNKNSRAQKDQDSLWAEVYKSIVGENRFRLACKVTFLRIIDAVICCTVLPRTVTVCRATEHCPGDPTLSELSKILYPAGVSEAYRNDCSFDSMFSTINTDTGSLILNVISVILISSTLLLAQLITLNKSYFAIMGHLAGEWKLVDSDQCNGSASQWDPRRRYKKGDLIVHSYSGFRQSVYMATTNSPEGRPFDLFLRATHDLFQQEFGHPSTSRIISACAKLHLFFMGVILMFLVYYTWMDYYHSALLVILFANIVACFGLLSSGFLNHEELEYVAAEINDNKD